MTGRKFTRGQGAAPTPVVIDQPSGGQEAVVPYQEPPALSGELSSMVRQALLNPRDEAVSLEKALKELEIAPEMAVGQWYSIPYKNHVKGCQDRKGCNCPEKPVEGLSTRAANQMIRHWRNMAVFVFVASESEDHVILGGVARDLEANTIQVRPQLVSKRLRLRDGRVITFGADEMVKALAAGSAKATRNAQLSQIPDYFKARYWQRCRELDDQVHSKKAGGKGKAQEGMLTILAKMNVTKEMLEKKLGHPLPAPKDVSDEDRQQIRAWINAIESGEAAVEDIFGGGEEAPEDKVHKVTPEQATGGKVEAKEDPAERPAGGQPRMRF